MTLTIDITTNGRECTVKAFWRSRQFVAVGASLLGAITDLIDSLTAAAVARSSPRGHHRSVELAPSRRSCVAVALARRCGVRGGGRGVARRRLDRSPRPTMRREPRPTPRPEDRPRAKGFRNNRQPHAQHILTQCPNNL